jgi:hypothetical protein
MFPPERASTQGVVFDTDGVAPESMGDWERVLLAGMLRDDC